MSEIDNKQTAIISLIARKSHTLPSPIIRAVPTINTHPNLPIFRANQPLIPCGALVNIVYEAVRWVGTREERPGGEEVRGSVGVPKLVG